MKKPDLVYITFIFPKERVAEIRERLGKIRDPNADAVFNAALVASDYTQETIPALGEFCRGARSRNLCQHLCEGKLIPDRFIPKSEVRGSSVLLIETPKESEDTPAVTVS